MKLGEHLARAMTHETRDPRAATTPVVYQSPGHPMIPQWDAQNSLSFAYYANVFVYRCVQVIAEAVAGTPFRVGADPDKPKDFDPRHPLARLLGPPPFGPNPVASAHQIWAWTVAQYLVTGRFGYELELDAQETPIALWPLPAPYLKPIPSEGGADYFSKFIFGKIGHEKTLLPPAVLYHWKPAADDWRQPESVLQAARLDVSVAVMQDRYDYAFLKNDARPASIVIYEGFETDAEDRAFKRQFRNDFGGPENAGRAMFVEADASSGSVAGAVDVKALGLSQKDSRAIERYAAKIQAICVAFGTPISKLGDSSARTFSNAGQENTNWWEDTILPLLTDLADAINIKLAPRFGMNVGWFDLSKVNALREEKRFTAVDGLAMYNAGTISGDELRAEVELPSVGLGFKAAPTAPIPVQNLNNIPALPAAATAEVVEQREEPRAEGVLATPRADHSAERRAMAIITSTTQVNALEHHWMRSLRRLFHRQAVAVTSRLEGKLGRQALRNTRAPEPGKIFDRGFWRDETSDEAQALYEAVFVAGAGRIASQFGISFAMQNPHVQSFIKARANMLAGQVTDTTYDQITTALADGTAAGETIPEIAQRVREVFVQADTNRAVTIARTEVISAYNGSAATVASQLPGDVVGGQEWIATGDTRTRDEHASADGQIVGIGEPFDVGGEALAYPGDPSASPGNVINCRCTTAFLTPAEMDARCWRVEKRAAMVWLTTVQVGEFDEVQARRALRAARVA